MVARHTRRPNRHSVDGCVCIDCGTRYLFTNTYRGNYCPDCHTRWIERQRGDSSTRSPPQLRPASRRPTADTDDTDSPYDEV